MDAMTDKPRDKIILLNSRDRLTKESLKEKLIEITCAYGRAKARNNSKQVTRDERKRGIWRNDDDIR
jgi:hypothetical protein